jgi:hypothetical protein
MWGVKMPLVGGSIYYGYEVRYTMGGRVKIPWVGGQNTMGRGSIYHMQEGQNTLDRRFDKP